MFMITVISSGWTRSHDPMGCDHETKKLLQCDLGSTFGRVQLHFVLLEHAECLLQVVMWLVDISDLVIMLSTENLLVLADLGLKILLTSLW